MTENSDERGRIPNLMNVGAISTDMSMDYDTFVLDPVVNTDTFCRFVLSNRGFLNSFSRIQLAVNANAGAAIAAASTLPSGIGIYSMIDRVSLRIGTEVVSEITDFGHWMAYKSMFIDNDINLERETYLTSRIMSHGMQLRNNDGGEASNVNASGYVLENKNEYNITVDGEDGELVIQTELKNSNESEFSLSVADLIPWLRFNQLPLYLFGSTQVSIEIHFTSATSQNRMVVGAGQQAATFSINTAKTQFIADYIYYDNDLMARFAEENRDMNWTYTDYRLAKRSYTHTDLMTRQIFNVGGAGRLCNKVISGLEYQFTNPSLSILNSYHSVAPNLSTDDNTLFTTNLIYNNNRLYPVSRTNPAIHFHDVIATEQNVPQITRQEYSRGGIVAQGSAAGIIPTYDYNGNQQSSPTQGLDGLFHWIGYRLNRNERVDSTGIHLELLYGSLTAGTYIHRSFLELVKTARLNNGKFSTELA